MSTWQAGFKSRRCNKRAKSETKSYVVYMTLTADTMGRRADELLLQYIVFAQVNAKMCERKKLYERRAQDRSLFNRKHSERGNLR